MQEALETPHFKKIWEKVIMNRHPKVNSLEEALVWESNINEALVATGDGKIYRCEDVEFCESNPYSVGINPKNNIKIKNEYNYEGGYQCIILGRPITLEDIINLFTKQEINKGAGDVEIRIFTSGELVNLYNITITGYVETGEEPQYHYVGEFFYSITKPLHEQTPETWEKIANLI